MYKLLILYLTNNERHHFFKHFLDLIKTSKNIEKFSIIVLPSANDDLDFYNNTLNNCHIKINYSISETFTDNVFLSNYEQKIHFGIYYAKQNNISYLMKCDNDILLNSNMLDYMIDNLEILENKDILTISPTLTTGIPTIENYIQENFNNEEKDLFYSTLLKTDFNIVNEVNVLYDRVKYLGMLNKHTIETNEWKINEFYKTVDKLKIYCRGIHPIRVNNHLIDIINQNLMKNKDKFYNQKFLYFYYLEHSYLCNSIFCIKTEKYEDIMNDMNLFEDGYDEIALNRYTYLHKLKHIFIGGGFAIHPIYNWFKDSLKYEKHFIEMFFN